MYDQLFLAINKYIPLSSKEKELLSNHFIYREVPNQYRLVEQGQVCTEIFFLLEGCVRLYYLKNGEEVSGFLFTENMFLNAFDSFLTGGPSIQILETVEPCQFLVLSKESLEHLYSTFPKMNILFRKILEERFVNAQRLVASFVLDKPEERYLGMIAANPALLQRFPQHILATFLGITPVSLSRIRKRIAEKQKKQS